jgi:hypothetical protein
MRPHAPCSSTACDPGFYQWFNTLYWFELYYWSAYGGVYIVDFYFVNPVSSVNTRLYEYYLYFVQPALWYGPYSDGPPVVTVFFSDSGTVCVGDTVTIKGSNFGGATGVFFNNVKAQSFTVDSDQQITAVVGAGTPGYGADNILKVLAPSGIATDIYYQNSCPT